MENITQELAEFVANIRFEDLPQHVVHESKRILLDSMGCALAGLSTSKGKLAVRMAKRLGGPPDSTILAVGDKVSSPGAAYANDNLINAMDYCEVPHVSPWVIPAPLALAECNRSHGKELILAVAIGHEIALRMEKALSQHIFNLVTEGPDRGKLIPKPVFGVSQHIFGGAAAAGKILKLSHEQIVHLLGLAGHMCPVPAASKWKEGPTHNFKYGAGGWVSHAEVSAALLAEMGYTGDTEVLDGDYSFWRFYGADQWQPELLLEGLGQEWSLNITYKMYPCCWVMSTAVDCLMDVMDKNNIMAEDIDSISALLLPFVEWPIWQVREVKTQEAAQFSVAHVLAVAAHRIRIGTDWQSYETIMDPRIIAFRNKISFSPHPEWGKMLLDDPRSNPASVEVVVKGKTFREERQYARGTYGPEEVRMTDEQMERKFRNNASGILPEDKIDRAIASIMGLEDIEDTAEVLSCLAV
jgi:2-methylcitrate dehydratase PrpD